MSASLLIGALIGFASAGGLRWWQYRRDLWLSRMKDLVDTIVAYSVASSKYWATRYESDPKGETQQTIDEANIIGLQTCVDGLLASIVLRMDETHASMAIARFNQLSISAAGGAFGGADRAPDKERARNLLIAGYALKVDISMFADAALTWQGVWRYVIQRARRRQDAAMSGNAPSE